jgi:alpha-L-fucosidase
MCTRRNMLRVAAALGTVTCLDPLSGQTAKPRPNIQQGPFSSEQETFKAYSCPNWFRDAKFGIWAHWGPSSAIEQGDWYARNMYIEGSPQYQYHDKTYGHPSKFGYKDTFPLWRAERFDPKALIRLYANAGAKYFVSMGVHCDNFDLWNSRNHRWNSVRMGPRRDIVGEWRQAARDAGLRFGVSEHVWASYNWWQTNKGADKEGPYAGVGYDGNDPANFDLYFPPHTPGLEAWAEQGNESDDWKREWFLRAQDLIDQHQPDLYYEDGPVPFDGWGRSLAAHYYNQSLRWHNGAMEVVYTGKRRSESELGMCTLDVERGVTDNIEAHPFQSDTCIGDWHYKRGINYKRPKIVIDLLVDIVSRNGNLLLNIPLPGSGMPDDEELRILSDITAWMKVNSEAIYGTRPWKVFGEGPAIQKTAGNAGMNGTPEHFNEKQRKDLSASDIRFTAKPGILYAFVMGHTTTEIQISSLSSQKAFGPHKIEKVELLGSAEPIEWKLADDGLAIASPRAFSSEHAITFKIVFG